MPAPESILPLSPPSPQPEVRGFGDIPPTQLRQNIFNSALTSAASLPPMSNERYTLQLQDVRYAGPERFSRKDQKRAILANKSLSRKLTGTWSLIDNQTQQPIAQKAATIANVPYLTDSGTFVNNGVEYTLAHQLRLKPGVFTREKENGELEAHVNTLPGKGRSHRYYMDPKTGVFKIQIGQAQIPLFPLLKTLGVQEEQLRKTWGNEITAANMTQGDAGTLDKLYRRLVYSPDKGADQLAKIKAIAAEFDKTELDEDVTSRTLGRAYKKLTPDAILDITKKLIAVNRKEADSDDRDSMVFQQVFGPEDLIGERFLKDRANLRQLLWRATAKKSLDHVPSGVFNKAISAALISSGLGSSLEEINPAEIFDHQTRVTRLGEGGIGSLDAVPAESRSVQPSHFGLIDYLRTPESGKVGVDMRFARGAKKGNDGKIYMPVKNFKTGETEYKTPQELTQVPLAFPGEEKTDLPMAAALVNGRLTYVPKEELQYGAPNMDDTFSALTNMVPMKTMVKGQRVIMGARMFTQALPLEHGEAPLVQSAKAEDPSMSHEDDMGGHLGAIRSDVAGRVLSVTPDEMVIKDQDGNKKTIDLYNDMPFNRKSVTGDTKIVVKKIDGSFYRGPIAEYDHVAGDLVLCVDPDAKISSWHKITGYLKHTNDKRLFNVTFLSGRSVTVTEDHSLITLDDKGDLAPVYPLDCVVNKTRCPLAFLGVRRFLDVNFSERELDWGRLVGLYLSAGHIPSSQPNLLIIAVAQDSRAEEVRQLILRLFPESNPYRNGGTVCAALPSVSQQLREEFGHLAHNKKIPAYVFSKSTAFLHGLIQGYFAGDGNLWADGNGAIQLTAVTVSKQLRDDLVDVLSALGVFATLFDAPRNHKNKNWRDGFGFRVISKHLKYLLRWFFYQDRHEKFYTLIAAKYRASPFDGVPITQAGRKCFYASFAEQPRPEKIYTWGSRGYAPKYKLEQASGNYGLWGRSDVLWDTITDIQPAPHEDTVYDLSVEKAENFAVCGGLIVHNTFWTQTPTVKPGDTIQPGQLIATSNFTDKDGSAALGLNLRVGYAPFRGRNYEDAVVISESAAKKLSSQHMYQHNAEWDDNTHVGKRAFLSLFPGAYDKKTLEKFDDNGAIKKGTVVNFGDPLVLVAKKREQVYGKLHRGRAGNFSDETITWDHHSPGIVTDVEETKKGVGVVVKSTAAMEVGDKLTGRFGDKGVVAEIVPDKDMPHDQSGNPLEILVSPLGLISRVNPAQIVEAALSKVAAKTGKPFKIKDFDSDQELVEFAKQELEKHGLSDTEDLTDPETGRKIKNILTGQRFFMKLHHTAESKGQGRAMGSYTAEGTPAKGGAEGAKRVGMLELGALLSHGAGQVVRDAKMVRGQANPEYWTQFMSGYAAPLPKVPHVYDKFVNQLKGAGVNVVRTANRTHVTALTDKNVDELAGDRELQNAETVDWAGNMKPLKGGLFDEQLTGGHGGNRWSKITLFEPMPNPIMEEPIRRVLGLTQKDFRAVLAGQQKIGDSTGPQAIHAALKKINLPRAIEQAREDIKSGRKTVRDAAVRRLGFLKGAEAGGVHPQDWMITKVGVLPPAFRPVSAMGAKKLPLVDDANYLYKEVLDANSVLKDASGLLTDYGAERLSLYDSIRGVSGLGAPQHPKNVERNVRGFLSKIFGSSPKFGTMQRKLLSSTVDLVGRAVITPNPDLDMDEVALPEEKAWEVYKPFVVRSLVRRGMPRLQALAAIDEKKKLAYDELNNQMRARPIIINRAPVLHRYGVMAFYPRLTKNKVLEVNPVITKGFGADFDGDAMQYHVPSTEEAAKEALDKMLPSKNLFSAASFSAHYLPNKDYQTGVYLASTKKNEKAKPRVYRSKQDALAAYRRGDIDVDTPVHIVDDKN